jgi:two-component system sensor histidine kinase PilS (NtrC family)
MAAKESGKIKKPARKAGKLSALSNHNWKLLQTFNYYRLAISGAALFLPLFGIKVPPYGASVPTLFFIAAAVYFSFSLIAVFTIRLHKPDFDAQATAFPFVDIVLIILLMHASQGIESGLGLLLLVSIAGGSLLLGKRLTIFYASLATVGVLIEHSWGLIRGADLATAELQFPRVGLLGIGLFVTALLTYTLANRLRATEALAQRQETDLANLANVNELIIQRMQSGVLACDPKGYIRMINKTARTFLGISRSEITKLLLSEVVPELHVQLNQWVANPRQRSRKLLRTHSGYVLLPRFILLGEHPDIYGILIFLEDTAILKQQAQQLKMAALARLTASIAHEIRNPLGAISNASQLLNESADQLGNDGRLVEIILEQSRRMNVIVENITQLGRRDRVNPIRMPVFPWLHDFANQYAETITIPKEALAVYCAENLMICIDPDQLHQVVTNLCQNALRHSPPYTDSLLIKFYASADGDGRPFLDVIDWGIGISSDIVDNIFEPFFTTTPKGTGLGLYIARELCEGNGATLEYHPGKGGGCRFRVTFAKAEECGELGAT